MIPLPHRQRHQLLELVERLGGDTDVRLTRHHPFGNLIRVPLANLQLHLGVACHEIAHYQRQDIACLRMGRRQDKAASIAGGVFLADPAQIFGFAQHAFGNIQHNAPRFCHARKAFATALENNDAEFILQHPHLLGNAGLRSKQAFRRLRNIKAAPLDLDDVTQLLEFHRLMPGTAETALATMASLKIIDYIEADLQHRHHHQLGNAVERIDGKAFLAAVPQ